MKRRSETFTDESAANAVAEGLNLEAPDWFCPLIKDVCRKDCVCYAEAFVWKAATFTVYWPCCGNPMLDE